MAETSDRWELVRKVVGLFTREEVKTPLSFYFKAAGYFVASLIAILYAPISDDMKYRLTIVAAVVLIIVVVIVTIFGWTRPRNLVYGEAGHRAERKLEFGTERRTISREQYDLLEGIADPNRQLPEGER